MFGEKLGKKTRSLRILYVANRPTPTLAQSGTLELIRDNQNPGGSSTGSALAVAAGYTPISIGGESDGSLTTPASRAALYALKCSPQTISGEGIFLTNPTFETIGGMAKSVRDLVDITQIILQAAKKPVTLNVNLRNDFQGLTLGFVNPPKWKLPETLFDSDESYLKQVVRFPTSAQTFAFCTT
jgi:amidase